MILPLLVVVPTTPVLAVEVMIPAPVVAAMTPVRATVAAGATAKKKWDQSCHGTTRRSQVIPVEIPWAQGWLDGQRKLSPSTRTLRDGGFDSHWFHRLDALPKPISLLRRLVGLG